MEARKLKPTPMPTKKVDRAILLVAHDERKAQVGASGLVGAEEEEDNADEDDDDFVDANEDAETNHPKEGEVEAAIHPAKGREVSIEDTEQDAASTSSPQPSYGEKRKQPQTELEDRTTKRQHYNDPPVNVLLNPASPSPPKTSPPSPSPPESSPPSPSRQQQDAVIALDQEDWTARAERALGPVDRSLTNLNAWMNDVVGLGNPAPKDPTPGQIVSEVAQDFGRWVGRWGRGMDARIGLVGREVEDMTNHQDEEVEGDGGAGNGNEL
ncbi:uncharacterized protein J4E88_010123 [Alternaria novae-zelandiae]|uniref:uncharacterized protein n=1 Tax=Alternaria triticimaculans TaxID=297637 RepID=UPI0020C29DE3|nr:uncharacterized protein J4E78_010630 [Alternaria triticimaculans]XP_049250498.1 uncharacterized protein J4E88_010123 [Alternaria novae-zelandiae]KAI4640506.1 hypothetical protein J4E78_010630 [Alternaria triticimaculans]KAI4667722.1 hypothetical protein J4E88_010123 [Alternaria novae-zelandiae]